MSWAIPKTVLGDKIIWDLSKIPGRKKGTWSGKDDQLWRCRKTKKFEASLLIYLPRGSTFVDGGAHFGDTIITIALYARETLQRNDLRFIAFEPNPIKAQFIRDCAAINGFDEETVRVIECVLGDETALGSATVRKSRYCEFDGRISYEWTDFSDDCEKENSCASPTASDEALFDVRRLDDFFDLIHPLGFLHLDVEGWEAAALNGASALLSTSEPGGRCYILAECFTFEEARRRGPGFSLVQEHDIMSIMVKFPQFVRGEDLIDEEKNLFFVREGS
ncbi:hypothetical protein ACHAW6_007682 [Cyclotella cf. meneghiniana]